MKNLETNIKTTNIENFSYWTTLIKQIAWHD